ncbi:MAG: CHAT domain-containing tetratricopeptide repeat protein [Potamolinea sp.]
MLRRIWQWLKGLFRRLFGTANQREGIKSQTSSRIGGIEGGREVATPQPLADSDYEYLFRQLLEGVSHGWQQDRVLQWFETLKQRVPKAEWIAWLGRFGERVLESPAPNHDLAARLVQVGEIIISIPSIREIGETAYNIGMQLLNRNPGEPIWEYGGPDASPQFLPDQAGDENAQQQEMETITLDELFARLQQDENLRLVIAQQLGIETTDPQELIQALINQFNPPDDNPPDVNPPDVNPPDDSTVRGRIAEVVAEKPQISDELELDLWADTTIPSTPDLNTPTFVEWEEVHFDESGNIETETSPQEAPTIPVDNAKLYQSETLFNQGIQQDNAGDWLAAIATWDKALAIKPDLYEAWYNRGLALGKLEKFEEEIASYDKALEFKYDYYEAWINRALALGKLGRVEESIISFDNALKIKPDDHKAWQSLGATLGELGRFEEAIASYDKALEFKPDFYEAWNSRGAVLSKLERFEEAIASFDKALEFKPDYHDAWYNRGVVLNKLGRFEEEIASYDKALEFKSDYYKAWINRALAAGTSVSYNFLLASLSSIAKQNPNLNQRGYQGALASYEEGLKYCQQETHPEGWGKLHHYIGQAYYFQGRQDLRPKTYWYKAINSYESALKTLTEQAYPEAHLEVLQDYIKVLLELGQTVEADELRRRGTDLLGRLLKETNRSDYSKQQLALKFVSFQQLTVDKSVKSGQLVEALEIAELGKNACLTWLLAGWTEEISSPNYAEIKQLLNPRTAIIYWHLSPAALTTFILKHNAPEPILISTPTPSSLVGTQDLAPLPEIALDSLQHLHLFEDWVKDWNEQYTDYRNNTKDEHTKTNHSWRVGMKTRLDNLKNILNIPAIEQQVKGIKQLILIPHRDLHIFPIHGLFNPASPDIPPFMAETEYAYEGERENFTVTYLPSAQIGLNIQQRKSNQNNRLLSVENPTSAGLTSLEFAKLESAIISQFFDNFKRIKSEQATKTQVENELAADYSIFHFAGHGSYNFTNPKQSALVLAANDKLTVAEIYQKSLENYNLVSLSACETYLTGKQTITNEYVGLISSFLSRGVGNVVSTQWTVESKATALLMIEFYKRRQPDKSEAKALAEAIHWLKELTVQQLKETYESLLQHLPPDELQINAFLDTEVYRLGKMKPDQKLYEHPYYWAAFTHTGKHC